MELNEVIDLVREEIQSYSDPNAPERMALARFITQIEKYAKHKKGEPKC